MYSSQLFLKNHANKLETQKRGFSSAHEQKKHINQRIINNISNAISNTMNNEMSNSNNMNNYMSKQQHTNPLKTRPSFIRQSPNLTTNLALHNSNNSSSSISLVNLTPPSKSQPVTSRNQCKNISELNLTIDQVKKTHENKDQQIFSIDKIENQMMKTIFQKFNSAKEGVMTVQQNMKKQKIKQNFSSIKLGRKPDIIHLKGKNNQKQNFMLVSPSISQQVSGSIQQIQSVKSSLNQLNNRPIMNKLSLSAINQKVKSTSTSKILPDIKSIFSDMRSTIGPNDMKVIQLNKNSVDMENNSIIYSQQLSNQQQINNLCIIQSRIDEQISHILKRVARNQCEIEHVKANKIQNQLQIFWKQFSLIQQKNQYSIQRMVQMEQRQIKLQHKLTNIQNKYNQMQNIHNKQIIQLQRIIKFNELFCKEEINTLKKSFKQISHKNSYRQNESIKQIQSFIQQNKQNIEEMKKDVHNKIQKVSFQLENNKNKIKIQNIQSKIKQELETLRTSIMEKIKTLINEKGCQIKQYVETPLNFKIFSVQSQISTIISTLNTLKKSNDTISCGNTLYPINCKKGLRKSHQCIKLVYEQLLKSPSPSIVRSGNEFISSQFYSPISKVSQQNQIINSNSVVYYIDPKGYLLDEDGCYLTDETNKQILLDYKMIQILKNNHIIKN